MSGQSSSASVSDHVESEFGEEHITNSRKRPFKTISTEDLSELLDSAIPANTMKKQKWALKMFEEWRENNNCRVDLSSKLSLFVNLRK